MKKRRKMYGQFFVIIAMILTGYLMRKINFIKKEMNNSLNKLIVYCAYPCMLAYNIGRMKMDRKIFCEFIWMMLITVIVMMSFALIMKFYAQIRRFPSRVSNVAELSMVYPNNGFMGFPIALSLLGSKGLLFMMAQNSAMNVMFFTHTMKVLHRNEKNKNNRHGRSERHRRDRRPAGSTARRGTSLHALKGFPQVRDPKRERGHRHLFGTTPRRRT